MIKVVKSHLFSLVELMVIFAVIAMLLSLLNPSLNRLIEMSKRTACSNHLRQIGIGAIAYANDFEGIYPACRGKQVQIAFNTSETNMLEAAGWMKGGEMIDSWNCPSRNFKTNKNDLFGQWIIGYQYFGGINRWRNPTGSFESLSPQVDYKTRPTWALGADTASKIDGQWGGGRSTAYEDMPSHKGRNDILPEGLNQVYADGSTAWVDFYDLLYLHSWSGDLNRIFYFYQKEIGKVVPNDVIKAQP